MATGLESAFDQQEEDVFAVEEGASTGYGSLQEALAAGQDAYNSSYLEQRQKSLDSAFNKLSEKDKKNLEKYETRIDRSSRDAMGVMDAHPTAYNYIIQQRKLKAGVKDLDLDSLMFDHKTMGRKQEDTDWYGEDSAYRQGADAQSNIVKDYLEESGTPLYKELEDGTRLYLTTGTSAHFDMDEFGQGEGKWMQAGDVGTYSTYWEPKPKRSFLEGMLANPVFRTGLAIATGGLSEAYIQTGRALTGEDLNSEDWASTITGGGTAALAAKAAITGDPTALISNLVTDSAIGDALKTVGVPQSLLDDPDFMAGVGDAVTTVIDGGNVQDALGSGLEKYVKEGGSFGIELPDAPDIDIDFGAVGDVVSNLASGVRDIGSQIGDVTDPLLSTIGDVGSATEDVVREVGSGIADAAEPFKEPLQETGRFIDDNLLQPVKDALLDGGGGAMLTGMVGGGGQPLGTRTTDSLFRDELFKFSPVKFTNVERVVQDAPREQLVDFNDDPFASDFNNRNLFG